MSARENLLVGRFDALHLDASQDFARQLGEPAIRVERPGLLLDAAGPDLRVIGDARLLALVIGRPHKAPTPESDATLLNGLRRDANACLNQLGGRVAVVWLDLDRRELAVASDRFNTRGLCWAREGDSLAFAIGADHVPLQSPQIDVQALFDYLYFHVIPAPRTVFSGVSRLEPGYLLRSDAVGSRAEAWWQPRFEAIAGRSLETLKREFRDTVQGAVAREAADGEVAAFLSGGTDSSTVVGMLRQVNGGAPRGYSIGFEAEGYDEIEYARIAAKTFGADHKEYYIRPADLVANIPLVAGFYDQPFGNSSALPAFCLAQMARADGYTKLLAGDGGDELYGGNTRYAKQRVFGWYEDIPSWLRRGLIEPVTGTAIAGRLPLVKKAKSYVEQARLPLPERTEPYNLLLRLGMDEVLGPRFLAASDVRAPMRLQRSVWERVAAHNDLDRQLGFDWRFTLADNDLPKVVGTTSLAGMDVGFPLLDDAVVDFSLALDPELKLRGLKLRWFFKEALRGFLPDEIITKKKHGFGLPFGHWALKDPALRELSETSVRGLVDRGVLNPAFVDRLFREHLPAYPGYYGEMVWISMMLEQWLRARAPAWRL